MTSPLPPINALWVGRSMGPTERACLLSFVHAGHPVKLFTYQNVEGMPEGVERRDAADILPHTRVMRHGGGSYAMFSNYFRYKLLTREPGYWVDTDVYCVRPFDFPEDTVFGWEDPQSINGAVLRLPPKSKLLTAMLAMFEGPRLPSWLPLRDRIGWILSGETFPFHLTLQERVKNAVRPGFSRRRVLQSMPWGSTGAIGLTYLADEFGLGRYAQSREVFYPAPSSDASWIGNPERPLESIIKPTTRAVHLWRERTHKIRLAGGQPGSFLARLEEEGGGVTSTAATAETPEIEVAVE